MSGYYTYRPQYTQNRLGPNGGAMVKSMDATSFNAGLEKAMEVAIRYKFETEAQMIGAIRAERLPEAAPEKRDE